MKPAKVSYNGARIGHWWRSLIPRRKAIGIIGGAALAASGTYLGHKAGILGQPITPPSVSRPQIFSTLLEASRVTLPEHENLMTTFADHLAKAFSQKYFVRELFYGEEKVHLIQSRTQGQQVVSEGFGYAMSTVVNYSKRLYAEYKRTGDERLKVEAQKFQDEYNALLRGVLLTLNKNGLPGWRCYYYSAPHEGPAKDLRRPTRVFTDKNGKLMEEGIELRSDYATYSAVDADLYIAGASVDAESLVEAGFWKSSPALYVPSFLRAKIKDEAGWSTRTFPERFTYRTFTEFMAAGIKNFDVEKKGKRLVLRVSDMWGGGNPDYKGGDIKGSVTANDSYILLNELYRLAQRFPHDRKFFLKLRKDSFDRIIATYEFGQKLFGQLITHHLHENKKTVRLESDERLLLMSLLYKITPTSKDTDLPAVTKQRKLRAVNGLRYQDGHLILDEKSYQVYQDGSWEIDRSTYLFVMKKIGEYGVHHFLPDQVEVEVGKDGRTYQVRFERNALNLSFTEGYDAIRVYAEIGKDLLMHNDTKDPKVPAEYKISGEEFSFLSRIMRLPHRNPEEVRANRYHNAVAISSYFVAAAGVAAHQGRGYGKHEDVLKFFSFMNRLTAYDIFDAEEGVPQYYNAMLSLKNISEFLARDVRLEARPAEKPLEKLKRVRPKAEVKDPIYGHEDTDFAVLAFKSDFQTFVGLLAKMGLVTVDSKEKKISLARLSALRRLHQAIRAKRKEDPASRMNLVEAYMGAGAYHSALKEAFETVRDMPDPKIELSIKILRNTVRTMVDIMGIFNISSFQISDVLEWLVDREAQGTNKRRFLELALLHEYNSQRRIGFARRIFYGLRALKKDRWEKVRHIIDLGPIGKNPLLSKEFATNLLSEGVFTLASDYDIEDFDPPHPDYKKTGYKARRHYYGQALYVLKELLGKDFPFKLKEKKAKDMWELRLEKPSRSDLAKINRLKEEGLTSDLKPRLIYSMGRMLQQMAYDQNDSIENRLSYSGARKRSWKHFWNIDREARLKEYDRIIENCDRAVSIFLRALSKEEEGIQDPKFLASVLNGILDAYTFKMTMLRKKANTALTKIKADKYAAEKASAYGGLSERRKKQIKDETRRELENVIKELDKIGRAVQGSFGSPWRSRMNLGEKDNPIDRAFVRIVNSEDMRSPDPRNINYINWIKKLVAVYINAGTKTRDARFFNKALDLSAEIVNIPVGNEKLKALFVIDTALKMGDAIYNYKEIQKEMGKSAKEVEQKRAEMQEIFRQLLGRESGKREVITPQTKKMCEYIRENFEFIREVYKDDPTQRAKIHRSNGNLLWWGEIGNDTADQINRGKALQEYNAALRIDPFDPIALLGAAELYALQHDLEQGVLFFARSLRAMSSGDIQDYMKDKMRTLLGQLYDDVQKDRRSVRRSLRVSIERGYSYISELAAELAQNHLDYLNELFRNQ